MKKEKNTKQKLFEMMNKLDSSFKLNETFVPASKVKKGDYISYDYKKDDTIGRQFIVTDIKKLPNHIILRGKKTSPPNINIGEPVIKLKPDDMVKILKKQNESYDNSTPSTRGIRSGESRIKKMFFNYTLEGHEATEDNAYDAARGLDWQEIETSEGDYPYLDYVDTINGVGIWYNYGHNAYYFSDESGEGESWRYIEENERVGGLNSNEWSFITEEVDADIWGLEKIIKDKEGLNVYKNHLTIYWSIEPELRDWGVKSLIIAVDRVSGIVKYEYYDEEKDDDVEDWFEFENLKIDWDYKINITNTFGDIAPIYPDNITIDIKNKLCEIDFC